MLLVPARETREARNSVGSERSRETVRYDL
jgi:hypothetical protein